MRRLLMTCALAAGLAGCGSSSGVSGAVHNAADYSCRAYRVARPTLDRWCDVDDDGERDASE